MRARVLAKCCGAALALTALSACQGLYDEETVIGLYGNSSDLAAYRANHQAKEKNDKKGKKDKGITPVDYKKDDKGKGGKYPEPGKGKDDYPDWGNHPGKDKDLPKQIGYPHDPGQDHGPGQDHDQDPRPDHGQGPGGDDDFEGGEYAGQVIGEQCSSQQGQQSPRDGRICLGLKYVVYQDPSESRRDPIDQDRQVADNVREVNSLWRECGIQFQVDRYLPVSPERHRLRYRTAHHQELNEIRRKFMDDRTLLVVTTGEWNRRGTLGNSWANAWTNLPGEQFLGVVMERAVGDNPNVLAHELGHYLSLDHEELARDLMHPIIYRDSNVLTRAQCKAARWAVSKYWRNMTR